MKEFFKNKIISYLKKQNKNTLVHLLLGAITIIIYLGYSKIDELKVGFKQSISKEVTDTIISELRRVGKINQKQNEEMNRRTLNIIKDSITALKYSFKQSIERCENRTNDKLIRLTEYAIQNREERILIKEYISKNTEVLMNQNSNHIYYNYDSLSNNNIRPKYTE